LTRFATDIARGMAYLHGREYFDDRDNERKVCILHRDLKPDNALITEWTTVKITDFGSSRFKAVNDASEFLNRNSC
jgi:serine/threonine protein kinase